MPEAPGPAKIAPFKLGDRVTPANVDGVPPQCLGRVYVVRKLNPKNIRCEAEDGGRGINFPAHLLLPATDENVAAGNSLGVPYESREYFNPGEVVTLTKQWKDWTTDLPLVVLVDKGDKVNVTPLGGADGRYLRVGPRGLVKRDLRWLYEDFHNRGYSS